MSEVDDLLKMPLRVARALCGLPPDPDDPLLEFEQRFVDAERERERLWVQQRSLEIAMDWDREECRRG